MPSRSNNTESQVEYNIEQATSEQIEQYLNITEDLQQNTEGQTIPPPIRTSTEEFLHSLGTQQAREVPPNLPTTITSPPIRQWPIGWNYDEHCNCSTCREERNIRNETSLRGRPRETHQ